ncbi:hypothetical protein JQ628_04820 [Bradyrhizobium lablabi]|uniref:hypothetical protein n=1 Tax=Bradyrhizobium lablabi TaxID=722472 RepID=UPI001BAAFF51|nr:hypothetical protein [Bradyrhizobium lablabi]MBR1120830.1 hypothetical protein [Bradyrhizobium lablabi]
MPVGKYFGYVGSALLALLFVFDACFGDNESNTRFDASLFDSATYAPRQEQMPAPYEFRYSRDMTPASRVRDVFAQFVPGETRRARPVSSAIIIVR